MTSCKLLFIASLAAVTVAAASCSKQDTRIDNNGATFYVDTVTGTFTPDELTSNEFVNRKFANFTACLKDNAMQSAIMDLRFEIAAGDVKTVKTTDDRGCLVWQELISYDPSDDEKQIPLDRSITALEGHSGTEVIHLAYDPWDSDKLVFLKREAARGIDPVVVKYQQGGKIARKRLSSGDTPTVEVDMRTTVSPSDTDSKKSFISGMTMQDLGRDFSAYRINSSLSLSIAHTYRIKFNSALIHHTFAAGSVAENVNAGKFKIYLAILKEGYEANNGADLANSIVAAKQFDGEIRLGRFIVDETLRFNNVAAVASRLTAIMTVQSVDHPDVFAETSFLGTLGPITTSGPPQIIDLIPTDMNARDLLAMEENLELQQDQLRPIDLFAQESGYVQMTKAPFDVTRLSTILGRQLIEKKYNLFDAFLKKKQGKDFSFVEEKTFGAALCDAYFDGGKLAAGDAYNKCLKDPSGMMNWAVRDFVESVNNPVPQEVGIPQMETITFSAGLEFKQSKSNANGRSTSRHYSLSAGLTGEAGLDGKLGGKVGKAISPVSLDLSGSVGGKISKEWDWYNTTSIETDTNDTTSVQKSKSVTVTSEAWTFSVDANVRTCFLFAPTPALAAQMAQFNPPQGKFFCADQVQRQNRQETYYFMNETTAVYTSPMGDNLSSADNPWRLFIRGAGTYNLFTTLFTHKDIKLVLEKMPDDEVLKKFKQFYVTQEFPGMLTP